MNELCKETRKIESNKIREEDLSKDVIYAICHGKDEQELNEYTMMALRRMNAYKDKEISQLINGNVMRGFDILSKCMKMSIIFYMLHIDDWTRRWACDEVHLNRVRPALIPKFQEPFFLGLKRLYKLNFEYKLTDEEFPLYVVKLYDYITTNSEQRK